MIPSRDRARMILSCAAVPFRLVYRAVLFVITLIVLGACYAVGGVPRIQPPERKGRITNVNPD